MIATCKHLLPVFHATLFALVLTISLVPLVETAKAENNFSLASAVLPKLPSEQEVILRTTPEMSNLRAPSVPKLIGPEISAAHEITTARSPRIPENIRYPSKAKLRCKTRLDSLAKQLTTGNEVSRTHAATDISFLERPAHEVVPLLQSALLSDTSKWVRRAAARSLGKIGSQLAVSALKTASNDRDKWVAHSAKNALLRITRKASR